MRPTHKKWFALGLIGIFIAIGGGVAILAGLFLILAVNRSAIPTVPSLLTARHQSIMYSIPIYIGICVCVFGIILSIIGWVKYSPDSGF